MSISTDFADAMAELASGVSVVTAQTKEGGPCGLVATAVCSYSMDPPSLLISIGHHASSHDSLVASDVFGVHLLHAEQRQVATAFSRSGQAKFAQSAWSWDDGVPRLDDWLVFLRCVPRAIFPHGDHSIIVAEVVAIDRARRGMPLIYHRREIKRLTHED